MTTQHPTPQPGPGLDLAQLRALRSPHPAAVTIPDRISAHLAEHDGYVAFSGGKDSLVALHLALQAEPNVPVVFFDSGFEYPETYQYLATVQEAFDIEIDWYHARHSTLEVLAATGHWDHRAPVSTNAPSLHRILITDPAARAHADHGRGEVWGVRAEESDGRRIRYAIALREEIARSCHSCCPTHRDQRRTHGGLIRRADGTAAYGPVWDWTTDQIWAHIARHQLPINPVYDKLRAIGAPEHFLRISHMLDAQRLEQGRVTWLRRGWPDLFDDIATVLPRIREYV